jgi:hypothetical protein
MAFMLTPWLSQIESLPEAEFMLRILGALLGVLGAPASLIIWIGMLLFCAREDDSRISSKAFWFILFSSLAGLDQPLIIFLFTGNRCVLGMHHSRYSAKAEATQYWRLRCTE